jgi:hypothetical protein
MKTLALYLGPMLFFILAVAVGINVGVACLLR